MFVVYFGNYIVKKWPLNVLKVKVPSRFSPSYLNCPPPKKKCLGSGGHPQLLFLEFRGLISDCRGMGQRFPCVISRYRQSLVKPRHVATETFCRIINSIHTPRSMMLRHEIFVQCYGIHYISHGSFVPCYGIFYTENGEQ